LAIISCAREFFITNFSPLDDEKRGIELGLSLDSAALDVYASNEKKRSFMSLFIILVAARHSSAALTIALNGVGNVAERGTTFLEFPLHPWPVYIFGLEVIPLTLCH
jgi:hypothetical protein